MNELDSIPTLEERNCRVMFLWHTALFFTSLNAMVFARAFWLGPNIMFHVYFGGRKYFMWRKHQHEREYRRQNFARWRDRISNPPSDPITFDPNL